MPDGPGQPVGDVVEGFRPGQRDPFAAGSLEWRGQSLRVVESFEKFQALDTADPAGEGMIPVAANRGNTVVDYRRHQTACVKAVERAGKSDVFFMVLHLLVPYDLKSPVVR